MATYVQRYVAFCDTVVFNRVSTQAEREAVAAVICPNMPADWTQAQKAEAVVREIVSRLREMRRAQLRQAQSASVDQTVEGQLEIPAEP